MPPGPSFSRIRRRTDQPPTDAEIQSSTQSPLLQRRIPVGRLDPSLENFGKEGQGEILVAVTLGRTS
jgi:hypothetical protein